MFYLLNTTSELLILKPKKVMCKTTPLTDYFGYGREKKNS